MSLAYLLLLLAPVSLFVTLAAHAAVFVALRRREGRPAFTPPISILKPVKGDEPGLYQNLASLAAQDYPAFELCIGAEDAGDAALSVARKVKADFPAARILVRSGERRLGLNPKVNLLAALCDHAQNDLVLISDSNVRVGPQYLRDTAAELADPSVGLVTNVLVGAGEGLGALLENLHINSFVASALSIARVAGGRACVIGKSMLFRRSDLTRLGGFYAVRNLLAEDFVIGRMFELAGYRVALSPFLVEARSDGWTLDRFINRHLRWAQMRRRLAPAAYCGELLLNPVLFIALASAALLATRPGLDLRWLSLAACGVAAKCLGDALVYRRLRGSRPRLLEVLAIPFKDLLIAALWLVGAFRRRVSWRGHAMRIEKGSRLTPAEPAGLLPQEAS